MVRSMTAYGHAAGTHGRWRWEWELRAVNGRGLDLKLRLPEGASVLEPELRRVVTAKLSRGSVTLGLRLSLMAETEASGVDADALRAHLAALAEIETVAAAEGRRLAPLSAADALALPGVVGGAGNGATPLSAETRAALLTSVAEALDGFDSMRQREGTALCGLLTAQLEQITQLCGQAEALAPERAAHQQRVLSEAAERALGTGQPLDSDRLTQELAMIAVKGDVTEELDRLGVHIAAAQSLLAAEAPVGRKLDFLIQEFNREANTLCSKAQFGPLTQIGLDLKATIDQMREQVQNVE